MAQKVINSQIPTRLVDRKLRELLEAQILEQERSSAEPIDESTGLLPQFLRSGAMQKIHDGAVDYIRSYKSLDYFEKYFAGRLFEDLAFMVLLKRGVGPVLSPEMTFEFYRWLHPYDVIKSNAMGFTSLDGVTVPDGLVLEEQRGILRIIAISEYTLNEDPRTFRKKLRGFMTGITRYPTVFSDSQLLFIIPEGNNPLQYIKSDDVATEYVPVNRSALREFSNRMLDRIVDNESSIRNLLEKARLSIDFDLTPANMYGKTSPLRTPIEKLLDNPNLGRYVRK